MMAWEMEKMKSQMLLQQNEQIQWEAYVHQQLQQMSPEERARYLSGRIPM